LAEHDNYRVQNAYKTESNTVTKYITLTLVTKHTILLTGE